MERNPPAPHPCPLSLYPAAVQAVRKLRSSQRTSSLMLDQLTSSPGAVYISVQTVSSSTGALLGVCAGPRPVIPLRKGIYLEIFPRPRASAR